MLNCVVLDDYQDAARKCADWDSLQGKVELTFSHLPMDIVKTLATIADADIIVAMRERTRFDAGLLSKLPRLKLLITTGMVNAAIDLAAAAQQGITVCGTRSISTPTPELTWGLLLALARHIPQEHQAIRTNARWQGTVGVDLAGKTIGIVGLGRIGQVIARYAKAFQMEALAWSPNLTNDRCLDAGVTLAPSLEHLLETADVVSLHMVLSETTRHMIGANELQKMKPTALLINTSRGGLIDTEALVAALDAGAIGGAALDVFDAEPLPADHALRRSARLITTPHIGYVSENNYRGYYGDALENIGAWLGGAPLRALAEPV
ncbi:D-2-hydroxyacid dehydrogenase family protein [Aminobacter sp. AP02]|uniref:D-2-hydroxyacid dehydrogenase family protein n=1 Tax=Aminobacter sp. AP02 TaxID=2135737 RepID=UPI000D6CE47B|nr:D-2-hydroxyacid dehydrogenase family protein [Aminobacter sp. AP02]PWK65681.1 phosphoglycerate dehydrogenase-like enzyme [Aminobacter sp. AP02]